MADLVKKKIDDLTSFEFDSPDEVVELTANIVEATRQTDNMIDNVENLNRHLTKFIEKQSYYNNKKREAYKKLHKAISEM